MDDDAMQSLHDGWGRWGCFVTLGLVAVVGLLGLWMVRRDSAPRVGAEVGSVAFVDAEGRRHTLAEYAGKVVVVDVWATWCPPCRASLPEIAQLQNAADGSYAVLPISIDDGGFKDVEPYLSRHPMPLKALKAYVQAGRASLEAFGPINGIPTTIIVDANGNLFTRWSGYYPGRAEKELKAALK